MDACIDWSSPELAKVPAPTPSSPVTVFLLNEVEIRQDTALRQGTGTPG